MCVVQFREDHLPFTGTDLKCFQLSNLLLLLLLCCRKSKTKPNGKKPPAEEKKQYLELEYTKIRVVDFDLKELVVLPREIDLNEWLASNSEFRDDSRVRRTSAARGLGIVFARRYVFVIWR